MPAALGLSLAVAAGSALGAMARYLASLAAIAALGAGLPWGTLIVNVAGSFVIGLYASLAGRGGRFAHRPALRQFVAAGFCGGFTTFSIFSLETLTLWQAGVRVAAAGYVGLSLALWVAGAWTGHAAGEALNRRAPARRHSPPPPGSPLPR